jgi:hypothetical protein
MPKGDNEHVARIYRLILGFLCHEHGEGKWGYSTGEHLGSGFAGQRLEDCQKRLTVVALLYGATRLGLESFRLPCALVAGGRLRS